jgi:hypothetical protein
MANGFMPTSIDHQPMKELVTRKTQCSGIPKDES